jgi:hypothetical protein
MGSPLELNQGGFLSGTSRKSGLYFLKMEFTYAFGDRFEQALIPEGDTCHARDHNRS